MQAAFVWASAPRPAVEAILHALPGGVVVLQCGEQVLLVGLAAPCPVDQALKFGSNGFNAAAQVGEAWIEAVKQDGAMQLGRLERAFLDGAHEDSGSTIAEQFDAALAALASADPPSGAT